MVVLPVLAGL
ncbi:hydroxypyruvate isomerase, partial [Yersinia pestis PY-02]